ncbi:MAG: efflux RND transporter periplasmic adaptor subunit [Candidatus Obscuribacterales bacterium]|nr:efflux RND transporter periplasmic adaptor subunit [Candidatus Obscuribacterales bacterium]
MKSTVNETGSVSQEQAKPTADGAVVQSRSQPFYKSKKVIVLSLISIVACVAVLLFNNAHSSKDVKTPAPEPVITVTTEKVAPHLMKGVVQVNGTVWAWDPLTIGSEVNGLRIESINVDEGDKVKRGQVLARLNASILNAQLAEEKAKLAAQEATLKRTIQPNRPEDLISLQALVYQGESAVAEAETMLTKARANLVNAQHNSQRYRGLVTQGAVSQQEADQKDTEAQTADAEMRNAEQKVRTAKFQLDQSKQRLIMGKQGGRKEDVDISRATVAQMKANVQRLEALVAQSVIKAPSDGLIMRRDAHLGEITAVGKALFLMVRDNRLELRAQVAEVDLPLIHPGQKVEVTDSTSSNYKVEGKVREVSPMVDQDMRLGTVRIDLPVADGKQGHMFKPGNFAHATIDIGDRTPLAVPAASVLSREHKSFVYVVNADNTVSTRDVKTGERVQGFAEVLSGLNPGETVVVRGAGFLKDGDLIRVGQ